MDFLVIKNLLAIIPKVRLLKIKLEKKKIPHLSKKKN
jgi:hypothetical protein